MKGEIIPCVMTWSEGTSLKKRPHAGARKESKWQQRNHLPKNRRAGGKGKRKNKKRSWQTIEKIQRLSSAGLALVREVKSGGSLGVEHRGNGRI